LDYQISLHLPQTTCYLTYHSEIHRRLVIGQIQRIKFLTTPQPFLHNFFTSQRHNVVSVIPATKVRHYLIHRRSLMFRRRFFSTALAFLLLSALLLAGGYALTRAGWSQGYAAGLQASGGEIAPAFPIRPFGPLALGFLPLLCGFGLLFFFGLFVLRFFLFGRRAWRWRQPGGPKDGPWMGPWGRGHWGHDHWQPWQQDPPEGQTEPPASAGKTTGPIMDL
jgi:hypothetical protein